MSDKRIKKIPVEELEAILAFDWIPVKLASDSIPKLFENIPEEVLDSVFASGSSGSPQHLPPDIPIPAGELIGGIDIYRNAPDDPKDLNKDWYAVIRTSESKTDYLVAGPIKDHEHWLDKIPSRLEDVEILSVPPKDK